jgi:sugar lactone lactonase YvrE
MVESAVASVILDDQYDLGESPYWDVVMRALVWIDVARAYIWRLSPETGALQSWHVDGGLNAVVPRHRGGMILARDLDFSAFDPVSGVAETIARVNVADAHIVLNDAKCDSRGRLWCGGQAGWDSPNVCHLYRMEADGTVVSVLEGVTISNGMGWSPDDRTMYFIDSAERRVDKFDFECERGTIARRRPLVEVKADQGIPDGLCVDNQGGIWVALWGGGAVHRYTPEGILDGRVSVPAPFVTSCAFGGPDLSDLFITTARAMSNTQIEERRDGGGLFVYRAGVRGSAPNQFAG